MYAPKLDCLFFILTYRVYAIDWFLVFDRLLLWVLYCTFAGYFGYNAIMSNKTILSTWWQSLILAQIHLIPIEWINCLVPPNFGGAQDDQVMRLFIDVLNQHFTLVTTNAIYCFRFKLKFNLPLKLFTILVNPCVNVFSVNDLLALKCANAINAKCLCCHVEPWWSGCNVDDINLMCTVLFKIVTETSLFFICWVDRESPNCIQKAPGR